MAGKKQFDEDATLERVMRYFWENGYRRTTMADLAAATGVQRGSLYNAYGGLEPLLLRSLDRYSEAQAKTMAPAFADSDPVCAMRGFLKAHLARMEAPENPPGCLMTQTALDAAADPVIGPVVKKAFQRTEMRLAETLSHAKEAGRLIKSSDPGKLGRYFLGVSRGMAVLNRTYGSVEPARDMAEVALEALKPMVTPST